MSDINIPVRRKRNFLNEDFTITVWENILPYFQLLLNREIDSVASLEQWLLDRSELESALEEDAGWRYIKMTCYTENEGFRDSFNYFIEEIDPKISPIANELDKKVLALPYLAALEGEGYDLLRKKLQTNAQIFREENIPLFTEMQTEQQTYGKISGAMTLTIDGKEITLQQAGVQLQAIDRTLREQTYRLIQTRRLQDKKELDDLLTLLIGLRDKISTNAGFKNYRDYMFAAMGRYDYTPEDCFTFHDAIAQEVVPILNQLTLERKQSLQLDTLKPWDLAVDSQNLPALVPFTSGEDLLEKTIQCFDKLHPYLGNCLKTMKAMGHLDLESRKGKSPGGYNYPLDEIGVPFIFMNATSTLQDLITMIHEGGHAAQSFLTIPLSLNVYRGLTSEIAELASMSMELISMDHWDIFFPEESALKRAKSQHLEHIMDTLPWVATIDKFQHWLYENPNHSHDARTTAWNTIYNRFAAEVVDWDGLQDFKDNIWQKQLHIYEVPFYYVEYGMAQLGAIAVWKNYKENPEKGLQNYMDALSLGYSKSIKTVYATAGIQFDFSASYIKELMDFVKLELEKCK
ncbi:MAG: hypothetical protein RL711_474 [Bacteroidota bacterium]|jgi:oligoendopeptidase F